MLAALVGHATTPDKLKLVTSAAGDIDTHVTYMDCDNSSPPVTDSPNNEQHTITTAATTDILAGNTSASKRRTVQGITIRNTHASVTNVVTVVLDAIDGNDYELKKASLAPGDELTWSEGLGWFQYAATPAVPIGTNFATAASAAGFASDTYIANSAIPVLGIGALRVGRCFHWRFIVSKTAAGTAAPVLSVRVGTAGTTADTARLTFTFGAGTAAADRGEIELEALVTAIGASAVLRGKLNLTSNLTTTGLSNAVKALQVTSSAFDITPANTLIGLSWNGGTSASHTIEYVGAYTDDF
jgi:hypothetical protein